MNLLSRCKRVAASTVTLSLLLMLAGYLVPLVVLAEGGLALSGSFHGQNFVIPQGAGVSGPSIQVVVFNNSSQAMNIRMLSQSPTGVTITFSKSEMVIPPGGQQQVLISVSVAKDVAPGIYDVGVIAQSFKSDVSGIQVAGASGQNAKLTVTGDSAQINLRAISPDGQAVKADIRLFRISDGNSNEVANSQTGTLEAIVAPGDFRAASYIGGQQVAELKFTLARGDQKSFDLTGATVYFASFGVLPAYAKDSGKLGFVQIVYTVKNIYQRVEKGEVVLMVNLNGAPLDPLTLVTLSPLELGSAGLNYNYTPVAGWEAGNYEFQLQLILDGRLYISSTVESLAVEGRTPVVAVATPAVNPETTPLSSGKTLPGSMTVPSPEPSTSAAAGGSKGVNLVLVVGIIVLVVVIIALTLVLWLRSKK